MTMPARGRVSGKPLRWMRRRACWAWPRYLMRSGRASHGALMVTIAKSTVTADGLRLDLADLGGETIMLQGGRG